MGHGLRRIVQQPGIEIVVGAAPGTGGEPGLVLRQERAALAEGEPDLLVGAMGLDAAVRAGGEPLARLGLRLLVALAEAEDLLQVVAHQHRARLRRQSPVQGVHGLVHLALAIPDHGHLVGVELGGVERDPLLPLEPELTSIVSGAFLKAKSTSSCWKNRLNATNVWR